MLKYYFISLVALLTFNSCQEIFAPDEIENKETFMVVEGEITDGPGPYSIKLKTAVPYNNNKSSYVSEFYISNAKVYIQDNSGYREKLDSIVKGSYFTRYKSKIKGTSGKSYKLIIEYNGQTYESKFIKMKEKVNIDSIYAKLEKSKVIDKSTTGEVVVTDEEGLGMYVDYSTPSNEKFYIRMVCRALMEESYLYYDAPGSFGTPIYKWFFNYYSEFPQIGTSYNFQSAERIKELKIGFNQYKKPYEIPADSVNASGFPMNDLVYSNGWVVSVVAYSISADAYKYFQLVNNQLAPNNSLFDPIPSQIPSNIKCITDTSIEVLGLFDVVSISQKYMYFYCPPTLTSFKTSTVSNDYKYPAQYSGQDTAIRPDFWIFY